MYRSQDKTQETADIKKKDKMYYTVRFCGQGGGSAIGLSLFPMSGLSGYVFQIKCFFKQQS